MAEACDKLPKAISETCHSFVQSYGDALIALLIQDIDPKDVCPKLYMCPNTSKDFEVFAPGPIIEPMEVTINAKNSGTEKCPLCLFAVQEAVTLLKDDKSTVSGYTIKFYFPNFVSNFRKTLSAHWKVYAHIWPTNCNRNAETSLRHTLLNYWKCWLMILHRNRFVFIWKCAPTPKSLALLRLWEEIFVSFIDLSLYDSSELFLLSSSRILF